MSAFCVCENVYRVPAGYKSEGSEWEYVSNYLCDKCETMVQAKGAELVPGDVINCYGEGFMVYPVREVSVKENDSYLDSEAWKNGERKYLPGKVVTVIAGNNSNMPQSFTGWVDSNWIWKVVKK